jgi:hypothetical protein
MGETLPESEYYHSALTCSTKKGTDLSPRQTGRQRSGFALPAGLCLATALFLASTHLATRGQSLHQLYQRSWTVREVRGAALPPSLRVLVAFFGPEEKMARSNGPR